MGGGVLGIFFLGSKQLLDKVGSAPNLQFLGHYAQSGIGRNKVHGLDASVTVGSEQQVA
jgi:hypothetical protein